MAEPDNRLETLEDEVKVLKGEVKRTLVDLRALLMREDSPLSEGAFSRRAVSANRGAEERPPIPEVPAMATQLANEPAPVGWETPAGSPGTPPEAVSPGPGPGPGPVGFSGAFPQPDAPGPGPGPGASPQPAMPGPGSMDVDYDRRIANLERMAGQEQGSSGQKRNLAERERLQDASRSNAAKSKRRQAEEEDEYLVDGIDLDSLPVAPEDAEPDSSYDDDELVTDVIVEHRNGKSRPTISLRNGRKPASSDEEDSEEEQELRDPAREGEARPGSRIYDEYRELIENTGEVAPGEASAGPGDRPLDVNLLSSLVYWVSLAKRRVGEPQMKNLLELYVQSGHSHPGLHDLLLHVSKMIDAAPPPELNDEVNDRAQVSVDLMFHLHGILAGALPAVKIPQVNFSVNGGVEADPGS